MNTVMHNELLGGMLSACALAGVTVVAGALLASGNVAASQTCVTVDGETTCNNTAKASVTVGEACTLSATLNTPHTATIPGGVYAGGDNSEYYPGGIGQTTLKTTCNDAGGYAIYAVGFTGEKIGDTNSTKLVGTEGNIATGTATSGDTSNWAMKLATTGASYLATLENGYGSFSNIPASYTKVASYSAATDAGVGATGSSLTTTYAAYISRTQDSGTYIGKVKYTMVHPSTETPLQPVPCAAGYICYNANASAVEGTMGRRSVSSSATTARLFASNFSRTGYGFVGWSDAYDWATNPNAHFYGPNEDITFTAGQYNSPNEGLALYAVWIKSAGTMQANAASVCNGLTAVAYSDEGDSDESTWSIMADLSSVSALTDIRDGQTYAIAKLADNKCWMIENLRLADTHQEGANTVPTTLTTTNTNNPLNDGNVVTLKHNYADTTTYTNLSSTSNVAYDETTAPEGWCTTDSAACDDQSRLRTDNTANRISYVPTSNMSTTANLYSYGNYYNWYSATAGRGTHGKNTGNAEGDLCPIGWRLPIGAGSGEFGILSNSLGGYKNASDVAQQMTTSTTPTSIIMGERLRRFPNNFLLSGDVHSGTLRNRGSAGSYWSSRPLYGSFAYKMYFNSSYVDPGTENFYKWGGSSVRCLVSPSN